MSGVQFVNTNTLIRKWLWTQTTTYKLLCYLFVAFDVHKEKTSTLTHYKYYLLCLETETLYKEPVASPLKSSFQNEVLHSEWSFLWKVNRTITCYQILPLLFTDHLKESTVCSPTEPYSCLLLTSFPSYFTIFHQLIFIEFCKILHLIIIWLLCSDRVYLCMNFEWFYFTPLWKLK